MKVVTRKQTQLSLHLIAEDDPLIFDTTGWLVIGEPPKLIVTDCNSDNCTLYDGITPPTDWAAGKYLFDGKDWTVVPQWTQPAALQSAEPVPVPAAVSMRQARLALLQAGKLADVDAVIAALPSPQKEAAQVEWEYATEVRRDSALMRQLAAAIGLDDAALNALFVQAATL